MQPLLALILMFGLMWVVLIRPQQRRLRAHQAIVASLRPGDEVVTAGGIYGTIVSVEDDSMILEVAPDIELRVLRAAVSQRVTQDEDDEIDDDEDEIDEVDEANAVPELADPSRDEES